LSAELGSLLPNLEIRKYPFAVIEPLEIVNISCSVVTSLVICQPEMSTGLPVKFRSSIHSSSDEAVDPGHINSFITTSCDEPGEGDGDGVGDQ